MNSPLVLLEYPMFRYAGTGVACCVPFGATWGKNGFSTAYVKVSDILVALSIPPNCKSEVIAKQVSGI